MCTHPPLTSRQPRRKDEENLPAGMIKGQRQSDGLRGSQQQGEFRTAARFPLGHRLKGRRFSPTALLQREETVQARCLMPGRHSSDSKPPFPRKGNRVALLSATETRKRAGRAWSESPAVTGRIGAADGGSPTTAKCARKGVAPLRRERCTRLRNTSRGHSPRRRTEDMTPGNSSTNLANPHKRITSCSDATQVKRYTRELQREENNGKGPNVLR